MNPLIPFTPQENPAAALQAAVDLQTQVTFAVAAIFPPL